MRRLVLLATVAVAGLALAATVAFAANTYLVQASVTPSGKGTKAKPNPVGVKFNYQVNDSAGGKPAAVKTYKIEFYGVKSNGKRFPACSTAKIQAAQSGADCPAGSKVGSGQVQSKVYQDADPNDPGQDCLKQLAVYNSGENLATLVLTGPGDQCIGVAQPFIIPAKFVAGGAGGAEALSFDVPPTVLHPLSDLTDLAQAQDHHEPQDPQEAHLRVLRVDRLPRLEPSDQGDVHPGERRARERVDDVALHRQVVTSHSLGETGRARARLVRV
jgi:hypothetical protein